MDDELEAEAEPEPDNDENADGANVEDEADVFKFQAPPPTPVATRPTKNDWTPRLKTPGGRTARTPAASANKVGATPSLISPDEREKAQVSGRGVYFFFSSIATSHDFLLLAVASCCSWWSLLVSKRSIHTQQ